MLSRSARLLTVPCGITLLCGLAFQPTQWKIVPAWKSAVVPTQVRQEPVVQKQERPKIVAVDRRIAKRLNALRPCVKQRLVRAVGKLPKNVTLLVTSAHRTREEQASLRGTFGIKARPGTSTHEDGRAVDLNVLVDGERIRPRRQHKVIGEALLSEGFRYLGAIDPVHYSVPKEKLDESLTSGPDLEVMTWNEMQEKEAEDAFAEPETLTASASGGEVNP